MNELIRVLSEIRCEYNLFDPDEAKYYSALSEAIRLLSEQQDLQPTCNQLATDCIRRQAAIDALWGEREKLDAYMDKCLKTELFALRLGTKVERNRIEEDIEIIKELPSAQPDWNELLVICDNCGHAISIKKGEGEANE